MFIKQTRLSEKGREDDGGYGFLRIELKERGKELLSLQFQDGEPEDNKLSRGFNDCYLIERALELAYEAGKRGDEYFLQDNEIDEL